jgi:hypothetical protein
LPFQLGPIFFKIVRITQELGAIFAEDVLVCSTGLFGFVCLLLCASLKSTLFLIVWFPKSSEIVAPVHRVWLRGY